ncbi:methyltransferase type 11 [Sphaerisporangium siamense]|uniref:SAM-dependent methyltransferase n=1 Tax=Sphaerisporangium siamense TaxID=795645 RepID=A0A7W7D5B6_9ACTN|nr:class I SAM-dependent methyltransferase [Sphaerisporangium siamense]MBB4700513.1 SAM-dependent methyltransferase [Sphaerisporangium siamense]GII88324.1 methyltransferase type 11 [Sphaerisporangium siamense]
MGDDSEDDIQDAAEAERRRLRATFTEDAELYDRARPGYPVELYDDLAEVAGVGTGCRVLEIGCGTGQATVPLAERGCRVLAVELGEAMARVARRNLSGFPQAEVVVSSFEDWTPPERPFDVVFSATAFHWVDPAVRVVKSAACLRPGGTIATVATHHVAGGSDAFFRESQDCYERFDPSTPKGLRLSDASAVAKDGRELDESPLFGPVRFFRYERDITYTTGQYLDVLRTYSNHRALDAPVRDALLACVGSLIDRRHGGRITKRYLTELRVAHRVPSGPEKVGPLRSGCA